MTIIAFAADHGGCVLKNKLLKAIRDWDYIAKDLGTYTDKVSVDYPDYAHKVANTINAKEADLGVLICGTGIGMTLAANRHHGIRAALCHNEETARLSREHNNANILALGARIIDEETALLCLKIFLETEFEGGRHVNRLNKIEVSSTK